MLCNVTDVLFFLHDHSKTRACRFTAAVLISKLPRTMSISHLQTMLLYITTPNFGTYSYCNVYTL